MYKLIIDRKYEKKLDILTIYNNRYNSSKNELISKVKGEAYFTYTLTLYGVLHAAPGRPSLNTHLHKINMNE